jgi:hypothetical protein
MSEPTVPAQINDPLRLVIQDVLVENELLSWRDPDAQVSVVRDNLRAQFADLIQAIELQAKEALLDEQNRIEDRQEMIHQCFVLPSAD